MKADKFATYKEERAENVGATDQEVWATIERLRVFPDTPSVRARKQLQLLLKERISLRMRLGEPDE